MENILNPSSPTRSQRSQLNASLSPQAQRQLRHPAGDHPSTFTNRSLLDSSLSPQSQRHAQPSVHGSYQLRPTAARRQLPSLPSDAHDSSASPMSRRLLPETPLTPSRRQSLPYGTPGAVAQSQQRRDLQSTPRINQLEHIERITRSQLMQQYAPMQEERSPHQRHRPLQPMSTTSTSSYCLSSEAGGGRPAERPSTLLTRQVSLGSGQQGVTPDMIEMMTLATPVSSQAMAAGGGGRSSGSRANVSRHASRSRVGEDKDTEAENRNKVRQEQQKKERKAAALM